ESERRKTGGNQQREWSLDADFWKLVGGQSAEIPDQAEHRSRKEERIEARRAGRASRAHHHDEKHRIEHDAGAQADQVQELAHDDSLTAPYAERGILRNRT